MTQSPIHCGTSQRRQRVAALELDTGGGIRLNGIDFIEVIDRDAPSESLRQRIIVVTFIFPDGVSDSGTALLGPDNFAIRGGSRVTGIAIEQVEALADANSLALQVDKPGDYSTYTLAVRAGPASDLPPAFIDSQLAEVDFTFKAECPSPFDCETPPPPASGRDFGPPIDYLAKDYESFRRQMLDRLATTLPAWREQSPADLGVTLVEVLAYGADQTSWFQDAIGTEAFLGRARLRQSALRHARLLGYAPAESSNARVAIAIAAAIDRSEAEPLFPRGTRLLTIPPDRRGSGPAVLAPAPELFEAEVDAGALVFETLDDVFSVRVARNAIRFHDWSDQACCLRAGATRAWLVGTQAGLDLAKGDLLLFEEMIPFGGAPEDPPDPAHRQCVRLCAEPVAVHDPVEDVDLVEISWFEEDALRFSLNLAGTQAAPGALARGNVVLAHEGRTVAYADPLRHPEDAVLIERTGPTGLSPDDGPGTRVRLKLTAPRIVHAIPHDADLARSRSAQRALQPTDELPRAQLWLEGDGLTWLAQPDLLASNPFNAHLKLEGVPGDYAVLFGDGALGRRPANLNDMLATVMIGGDARGNVAAEAIGCIVTPDAALVQAVRNPLPGLGGREPEPMAAIRTAAPQAFRSQRRAVTLADYATAAERYATVQRVHAERRWTGSWHTVYLSVDRSDNLDITPEFESGLRAHLAALRLAGHDLQVVAPIYVPLDIRLFVCACSDHYRADVERALLDSFSAGFTSAGLPGYFHPDNFSFGDNILLSPIIARGMAIPGVSWIGARDAQGNLVGHFGRADQPDLEFETDAEIPIAPAEVARLDNDPNYPERGRIRFDVAGGR